MEERRKSRDRERESWRRKKGTEKDRRERNSLFSCVTSPLSQRVQLK